MSDEITGVDVALAVAIIAELGVDMRMFENVSELASWAGVCPGNNASGRKRRSSRIPKGNAYPEDGTRGGGIGGIGGISSP